MRRRRSSFGEAVHHARKRSSCAAQAELIICRLSLRTVGIGSVFLSERGAHRGALRRPVREIAFIPPRLRRGPGRSGAERKPRAARNAAIRSPSGCVDGSPKKKTVSPITPDAPPMNPAATVTPVTSVTVGIKSNCQYRSSFH